MSQKRYKKQLDTLDNASSLTDHELREALKRYGQSPGPITDSTRNLYRKKLVSLIDGEMGVTPSGSSRQSPQSKVLETPLISNLDEDSDTSDEDYEIQEDEDEESDETDEDEEADEEEDPLMEGSEDDEETNLRNISGIHNLTTNSLMIAAENEPNRISRAILISLVSFFVVIFTYYLHTTNKLDFIVPSQPLKSMTKRVLILLALSPIAFAAYKITRIYQQRRYKENQKVCELVDEALGLLQSPDNPRGLMPILHIRDTLLTPAERKSKNMIALWNKSVKFVEEHESRVKVELINIDGEDFRAWKWIGSRKL